MLEKKEHSINEYKSFQKIFAHDNLMAVTMEYLTWLRSKGGERFQHQILDVINRRDYDNRLFCINVYYWE